MVLNTPYDDTADFKGLSAMYCFTSCHVHLCLKVSVVIFTKLYLHTSLTCTELNSSDSARELGPLIHLN